MCSSEPFEGAGPRPCDHDVTWTFSLSALSRKTKKSREKQIYLPSTVRFPQIWRVISIVYVIDFSENVHQTCWLIRQKGCFLIRNSDQKAAATVAPRTIVSIIAEIRDGWSGRQGHTHRLDSVKSHEILYGLYSFTSFSRKIQASNLILVNDDHSGNDGRSWAGNT